MADTTNTAEIRIVADSSGVEAGLQPVITAAQRAERAIEGIGGGATRSASTVAGAERSLIGSIQRTTAQMEAGSRTGARYYEVLAQQRGVNPAALEPYLRQLRAVEQAQQRAGQAATTSAAQTAAAMRQLPAQLTDVVTSLQGGQNPLTVLLQQGGQVRDSFGSIGGAVRAVGSQVLGLLTPYTVIAAAAAGLTLAYAAGARESRAYATSIAATGNVAGLTANQMADAARQVAAVSGTQGAAAEVVNQLVATGRVSAESLAKITAETIAAQRDLGREVGDTVKEFAELGKSPAQALRDLNERYHLITAATYAQVKALEEQGRTAEAANLAQQAYAEGIAGQRFKVLDSLTDWERGWIRIKKAAIGAVDGTIDALVNLGRQETAQKKITSLLEDRERLERNLLLAQQRRDTWLERSTRAAMEANQAAINVERDREKAARDRAAEEGRAAKADELRIKIRSDSDKLLSREEQRTRALAAARTEAANLGLKEAEIQQYVAIKAKEYKDVDEEAQRKREKASREATEQLKKEAAAAAEAAGLTSSFAEDWKLLSAQYAKGAYTLDQLTAAQAKLLANQPAMKAAAEQEEKSRKKEAEAVERVNKAYEEAAKARDSVLTLLQAQRDENEQIGLTGQALANLVAQRLENQAAQKDETAATIAQFDPGSNLIQVYRDQAEALRDLAAAKREGARTQIGVDSAKKAQEEWKRAADSIEQSLTDALLRGFESGKSFGQNLVDTLKNMFNTLILRPIIQAAVTPMSNQITSFMQGGGSGAGGTGASGLSSLASMFGKSGTGAGAAAGSSSGMFGAAASYGGWIAAGMAIADGLYKKGFTDPSTIQKKDMLHPLVGESLLFNKLFQALGLSNKTANLLSGASIATALFGRKAPEIESQGFQGTISAGGFDGKAYANVLEKGGVFRSDKRYTQTAALGAEQDAGFDATIKAMIDATKGFASVLGIEASVIEGYNKSIKLELGKDEAKNQEAIAKLFGEVSDELSARLLPSIASFTQAGETASATLQRLVTDYATVDEALTAIGAQFGAVGVSSLGARERLIDLSGGLEAFVTNTAGFQQNFLSEMERNAPVLKSVTEQLAAMGLAWVDTRDEFKEAVLSTDPSKDGERFASLMKLQAAFAQVYPAIDKAAIAAAELAKAEERANAVRDERLGLQGELDQLTMTEVQLLEQRRAALDESNRPLFDQINAIKESKAALEAQAEAQRVANQAAKDHGANLLSGVDSAFSALQTVVGREKALLQDTAGAHRALSDALRGTLDNMRAPGREREDRLSAQAQIQAALAIAKAGGMLPDVDGLKGALSVVGKDSASLFSTQEDYLRDFYSTQNDIADLAGLTDKTLSAEEQSIKRLDDILANAQQQVNALKGLDTTMLTLVDVMRGFDRAAGAANADPVASSGGNLAKLYKDLLGRAPDAAGMQWYQGRMAEGVSLAEIRKAIMGSDEREEYLKSLRGFAVGTNYVPTNMPAMIHEGERIVPAADNRELMRRLSSPSEGNSALVAEVRALRTELEGLRAETRSVATHAEKSGRLLGRVIRNDVLITAQENA